MLISIQKQLASIACSYKSIMLEQKILSKQYTILDLKNAHGPISAHSVLYGSFTLYELLGQRL